MDLVKACTKCHLVKSHEDFPKGKKYKTGRQPWCRKCFHDRYAERAKQWKLLNPEKAKHSHYKNRLKTRYGMTEAQHKKLYKKQNRCCAVCQVHEDDTNQKLLVIDHCHKTGLVRGLLCRSCNLLIGLAKDDRMILLAAITYLKSE